MVNRSREHINTDGGEKTSTLNVQVSRPKSTVSLLFFVISLLVGVTFCYYLGRTYRTQIWKPNLVQETNREKKKLLASANYRRTPIKVSEGVYKDECASSEELIVEEVFFQNSFGQYNQAENNEDDDEEEEEENEGGDSEDSKRGAPGTTIIIDFERLDPKFLSDHAQVRESFLNIVWDASESLDIAVLSVHCQVKLGVTCVAILKDGNYMSIFSEPLKKQCSFDIFIAGDKDVLDLISIAQQHLDFSKQARMRYSYKLRGTRPFSGRYTNYENDLGEILLENKDLYFHKRQIGTTQTEFQSIHVYEALSHKAQSLEGYEKSLETDVDNYYTQNPELFRPNQWLFLDGVMQSSYLGDAAYHEALVHPAMLAHSVGPKRVAIIGGGEGATLREVLKHKSVERCTMVEIDAGMVEAARNWLPWMNNCSDFGDGNCFDDKRTDLRTEDAFAWFLNRFSEDIKTPAELQTDPFDVIVMDALDPEDPVEFAVHLYNDLNFWGTILEAINDDGFLVMQLGISPTLNDPGEQFGRNYNRATLFNTIEAVGFKRVFLFEEGHSNFLTPWSYLVACKSEKCAKEWYLNEAELDLRILERILPTKSGTPALKYVDGSTIKKYRRPSSAWQAVYCRKLPRPVECATFADVNNILLQRDAFKSIFNNGTKATIAKVNMVKGTVISSMDTLIPMSPLTYNKFELGSNPINTLSQSAYSAVAWLKDWLKNCNITRALVENDFHTGKISPLLERHQYMQHMQLLEIDIEEGMELPC